jgi:hypothetical protein
MVPDPGRWLEDQPIPCVVQPERQIRILEVRPEKLGKSPHIQYCLSPVEGSAGTGAEDVTRIFPNFRDGVSVVSLASQSAEVVIVPRAVDPNRIQPPGCRFQDERSYRGKPGVGKVPGRRLPPALCNFGIVIQELHDVMLCEPQSGIGCPGEPTAPIEAMDGCTHSHGNLADDCVARSIIDHDDFTVSRPMAV